MTNIYSNIKKLSLLYVAVVMLSLLCGCSDSEDPKPRTDTDLVGVWSDADNHYLYIQTDTEIHSLYLENYDGQEVGMIEPDGYIYEPGYNFVVYMGRDGEPTIYQLEKLTEDEMVWVWADNILDDKYDGLSRSEILGKVLTAADKGFTLDYSRTKTFRRIPEAEFLQLLAKYGLEV